DQPRQLVGTRSKQLFAAGALLEQVELRRELVFGFEQLLALGAKLGLLAGRVGFADGAQALLDARHRLAVDLADDGLRARHALMAQFRVRIAAPYDGSGDPNPNGPHSRTIPEAGAGARGGPSANFQDLVDAHGLAGLAWRQLGLVALGFTEQRAA